MAAIIGEKFTDYLDNYDKSNIHEELKDVYQDMPNDLAQMNHIILYGPSGVGKYRQALAVISKYDNI